MNTVAYLRVSTPQQDVRSQRLAILNYVRKHDFLRIDDFIEATASGRIDGGTLAGLRDRALLSVMPLQLRAGEREQSRPTTEQPRPRRPPQGRRAQVRRAPFVYRAGDRARRDQISVR